MTDPLFGHGGRILSAPGERLNGIQEVSGPDARVFAAKAALLQGKRRAEPEKTKAHEGGAAPGASRLFCRGYQRIASA